LAYVGLAALVVDEGSASMVISAIQMEWWLTSCLSVSMHLPTPTTTMSVQVALSGSWVIVVLHLHNSLMRQGHVVESTLAWVAKLEQ